GRAGPATKRRWSGAQGVGRRSEGVWGGGCRARERKRGRARPPPLSPHLIKHPQPQGVRVSQEVRAHHHETELARELTLFDTINIVIGTIIGSGIFLVPSEIARAVRTPGWMLG